MSKSSQNRMIQMGRQESSISLHENIREGHHSFLAQYCSLDVFLRIKELETADVEDSDVRPTFSIS